MSAAGRFSGSWTVDRKAQPGVRVLLQPPRLRRLDPGLAGPDPAPAGVPGRALSAAPRSRRFAERAHPLARRRSGDPAQRLRIYARLELDGFEQARPRFARALEAERFYPKRTWSLSPEETVEVARHLAPVFGRFGHTRPVGCPGAGPVS